MQLTALVALYVRTKNAEADLGRELSANTVRHLDESVRAYSTYLARDATTSDLTAELLNSFLAQLLADGRSPWGVKSRRTALLVLWRFAQRSLLIADGPERVRRVHCPPLSPDGFDVGQMERLLNHVATLRFSVPRTTLPKTIWWDSLLRVKWDLLLRAGDILRVRPCDFRDGWLWTRESKTGKQGWLRLRQSAADSLAACIAADPGREFTWPGYQPKGFYKAFKRLAVAAGVPGTSRYVRSGAASEGEAERPGYGWRLMRHGSPVVFSRHYQVRRITERDAPGPPELGRAG